VRCTCVVQPRVAVEGNAAEGAPLVEGFGCPVSEMMAWPCVPPLQHDSNHWLPYLSTAGLSVNYSTLISVINQTLHVCFGLQDLLPTFNNSMNLDTKGPSIKDLYKKRPFLTPPSAWGRPPLTPPADVRKSMTACGLYEVYIRCFCSVSWTY